MAQLSDQQQQQEHHTHAAPSNPASAATDQAAANGLPSSTTPAPRSKHRLGRPNLSLGTTSGAFAQAEQELFLPPHVVTELQRMLLQERGYSSSSSTAAGKPSVSG